MAEDSPRAEVLEGEALEVLEQLEDGSVESVVTDPPYGLQFMGADWDGDVPGAPYWRAVQRVAKPGAHLLAFGGTRTYHRLATAIEDAGWTIRDCLAWVYGEGFPKSLNVETAVRKQGGDDELAASWRGWGTALKPAFEPIVLARAPLDAPSVGANVARHGAGALNIDESRIPGPKGSGVWGSSNVRCSGTHRFNGSPGGAGFRSEAHKRGRWPANLILDEAAAAELDRASGRRESGIMRGGQRRRSSAGDGGYAGGFPDEVTREDTYGDAGGASRFFYCAKAGHQERQAAGEFHPTVKPLALMRYLVRLVTPSGGVVLDPFAGSGTTLVAAAEERRGFVGIELQASWCAAARRRLRHVQTGLY